MTTPDLAPATVSSLLDMLPDPALLVNPREGWRVCQANPAAAHYFCGHARALPGQTLPDLWPELGGHAAELEAAREGEARTLQFRSAGPWAWVGVRAYPAGDLLVMQFFDVTAHKAAEARSRALFDLTSALSRTLTAQEAAEVVLRRGLAALDAATGSVFILDPAADELVLAGFLGYDEAYMRGWQRFPAGAPTLLGDTLRGEEPLFLRTADVDARYPHLRVQRTVPTHAVAALPLSFGGRAVGVMNFGFAADQPFDEPQRLFLLALAEQLAQALERARLFGEERRGRERAALLADAGELLTSAQEPQDVLDRFAQLAVPRLGDWCNVVLPDGQGHLVSRALMHHDPAKVEMMRLFRERARLRVQDDTVLARVFQTGEALLVPEVSDPAALMPHEAGDPAFTALVEAASARSVLAVPLVARGETLGVMSLVSHTPGRFGQDDLAVAQELARRAALALDNARLAAERETALRDARSERARLAAVLENAPAVGYLKDREGRYGYVNAAFEALFRLRREDVLGRTDVDLFGEAVGGALRANDLAVLSGGTPSDFEENADTPRGPVVYRSVKFPLPGVDGALGGTGGLSLDVTAQRAVQDALAASEARYQALIEVTRQYAWTNSPEGEMLGEQPGWARLTGQTPEEYRGYGWAERLHPEDREGAVEAWHQALRARSLYEVEQRVRVRDGTHRHFLVRALPLLGGNGEVREWVGLHTDVTELKQAEVTLRAWGSELERQVAAQTRELSATNEELGAFVYTVSHDLRAPVRHVSGFAALLRRRVGDNPGVLRYVDQIGGAAARMEALIEALLTLARSGAAELHRTDIDLEQLVAAVRLDLRADLMDRVVTWRVGPLPVVRADEGLLRQVLANLLGNAVKYSRGREEALVEVSAQETPDEVTVTVRDNGAGFDPQYAQKLFGVFQRLHHQDEFEGTGVGLANVRRIVEKHGGRVWASARPGEGATFSFSLPRA